MLCVSFPASRMYLYLASGLLLTVTFLYQAFKEALSFVTSTRHILQPNYSKHRWTIWQCRPVCLSNSIVYAQSRNAPPFCHAIKDCV